MPAYQLEIRSRAVFEPLQPGAATPSVALASLDGLRVGRRLADDLDPELTDFGITGGEVRIEWKRSLKRLTALATFLSPAKLTRAQERLLIAEVRGQYSDGFAENGIDVKRAGVRGRLWLDRDRKLTLKHTRNHKKAISTRQLLQPARLGNLAEVVRLIAKGARVNARGAHGTTPLIEAVQNNHQAVIATLLAADARVDLCTNGGVAPLQHACMSSASVEIHRLLLDGGAAVNALDEQGATALHYAANRGLLDVTRLLIEHGADLNVQDERGCTPLMLADPGHADVINLLLLSGARTDLRDDRGYTAVEHALDQADAYSRMGHDEIERVEAEGRKAKLIKQFQGRRKRR